MNKIFRKIYIMMKLKVTKKQRFTLSSDSVLFKNIFSVLRCGYFLNETSILVFEELAIFTSI